MSRTAWNGGYGALFEIMSEKHVGVRYLHSLLEIPFVEVGLWPVRWRELPRNTDGPWHEAVQNIKVIPLISSSLIH